jgi:ATP-dependent DNA helicase RecG
MARPLTVVDSYTPAQFADLVCRETDRLELKTGAGGRALQEAMVALSNTDGGVIFIGVDDDRTVIGKTLDQATDERIHAAAVEAHNIGRYHVRQITVGGRPIVAVEVHRREEGIAQTSDGRILIRRGPRNQSVIGDAVWRLVAARTLRRFELADSGVPTAAIDDDNLRRICAVHGWNRDDPRLEERGLASGEGQLTIAGALLLTRPQDTLSASKFVVEVRRYDDDSTNYRRRVVFGGALHNQVEEAANYVSDEVGSDLVIIGLIRHELQRLPRVVIREAIANAVAHRSYELGQSAIVVEIRPQRVTITSPGRLPEGVTVETLRQAQAARNPVVIDVLRRFGLTEDAGRGVDVMQDTMRDEMLDPPVFAEVGSFVRVTLLVQGPIAPQERVWLKDLEAQGVLEPSDRLLLVHAARGAVLTNAVARGLSGLDREHTRMALKRLRDNGLLVQQGQRGGATYLLDRAVDQGAARRLTDSEVEQLVLGRARQRPIRNEDIRRLTGLDRSQTVALLNRLVSRGELIRKGSSRGTRYTPPA